MTRRFYMHSLAWPGLALLGLALGGLALSGSAPRIHSPAGQHTSRLNTAEGGPDTVTRHVTWGGKRIGSFADSSHHAIPSANSNTGNNPPARSFTGVSNGTKEDKRSSGPNSTAASFTFIAVAGIAEVAGDRPHSGSPAIDTPVAHPATPILSQSSAEAPRPASVATALKNGALAPIVIYGDHSKDDSSDVLNDVTPSAAPEPSSAVMLAGLTLLTGLVLRRARLRARIART